MPCAPLQTSEDAWPALPLAGWRDTCATLHMWTQVVGKTRLALAPQQNHWWHCTLYVSDRGLTTTEMKRGDRSFTVEFDFVEHVPVIRASDMGTRRIRLVPQTVARFYEQYVQALRELRLEVHILARPVEVEKAIPFAQDEEHASYDAQAAHRWWRALVHADRVFKRFRGGFRGKQSPVHFFWGGFDLAVTRFSGRPAPPHPGGVPNCADWVMVEAYSRECSSAGFWPGGGAFDQAAFYAYAYPEPEGYAVSPVAPEGAFYHRDAREFILPYEAVRSAVNPEDMLMQFLESTYDAAARCGRWDREALEHRP